MALFATKWDFLHASVLIGIDRSTGVFSGNETVPGKQMVCVWTDMDVATESLHVESWDLQPIAVRHLLALLPSGIGVVVDPERSTGMTASASYIAQLKPYADPFPVGSEIRLAAWDLPEAVRGAAIELHAFAYTVDDSPLLGCIAHDGGGAESASIETVLSASGEPADLGVSAVRVLSVAELPAEVRAGLGDGQVMHRRRSKRWWRRGE